MAETRKFLLDKLYHLIEQCKLFSSPEIDGIKTKQYYHDIAMPLFQKTKKTYSYIFGDFNKLNTINEIYGHDFGDQALELSFQLIKDSLPSNASIFRLGGDEIVILLPNMNIEDCQTTIVSIQNSINLHSEELHGLTIELASADSSSHSIQELYQITEKSVSDKKASRKKHDQIDIIDSKSFLPLMVPEASLSPEEVKSWETLNKMISVSTYNFLQHIRPAKNFEFNENQLKDLSWSIFYLLASSNNLSPENDALSKLSIQDVPFCHQDVNPTTKYFNSLDSVIITMIDSLINNRNFDLEALDDNSIRITVTLMEKLLDDLVRDPSSHLLNKNYLRLDLAEKLSKKDQKCQAIFVTAAGIKMGNSAYGHNFMDSRLYLTSEKFVSTFSKYSEFNNDSFSVNDNDTFLISHGAGNFLILNLYSGAEPSFSQEKMDELIQSYNNHVDLQDPSSPLPIAYAMDNDIEKISTKNFIDSIRSLKEKANDNKTDIKRDYFRSIDFQIAFKNVFQNCVDFYSKLTKGTNDSMDFYLARNIFNSFVNYETLHNLQISKNESIKDTPNFNTPIKEISDDFLM